jgi:exonuclease III
MNVRGLNEKNKRTTIRKSLNLHRPDIICLQEIKKLQYDFSISKRNMWVSIQ